ncbi:MAG: glucosaminidase domain-containing protein [Elusimicrobiota bacterium]|jgi:hypothetical protein|nr:glucosaminidase domain-containing protein [Elusimicrobiota bacterium]
MRKNIIVLLLLSLTFACASSEIKNNKKGIAIQGKPVATQAQCARFLKKYNPDLKLKTTHKNLVKIYYQEGIRENIRPDMAFAQSLLETGYFKFPAGGDVKINQNNFAGLGATGKGARGAKFRTIREGVRAQIQHLKAYASKEHPKTKVVDPRYHLLYNDKNKGGKAKTWNDLTGKWAVDPKYGEKITAIYNKILEQ